jgi:hypothetical protein
VALADLIKGRVQVVVGSSIQLDKGGQVRALAITGTARWPSLPDVVPLAQFLPGSEATWWSGYRNLYQSGTFSRRGRPADGFGASN